jgi:hypothetical protein
VFTEPLPGNAFIKSVTIHSFGLVIEFTWRNKRQAVVKVCHWVKCEKLSWHKYCKTRLLYPLRLNVVLRVIWIFHFNTDIGDHQVCKILSAFFLASTYFWNKISINHRNCISQVLQKIYIIVGKLHPLCFAALLPTVFRLYIASILRISLKNQIEKYLSRTLICSNRI